MSVALFIPCYVDLFYPNVAQASLTLLENAGVDVVYPEAQTCCGQPMANTGCMEDAAVAARHFLEVFGGFDAVVAPSGSCVSMVRNHYAEILGKDQALPDICTHTYELCEYMTDHLNITSVDASFPHKVGLHQSCHGLRELRLASSSERMDQPFSKVRTLLESVEGLTLVDLEREDECCGFGGLFSISEEAVSCSMGRDRVKDHLQAGAEYITGVDMSCLMHMGGLIKRDKSPTHIVHVAEILAGVVS